MIFVMYLFSIDIVHIFVFVSVSIIYLILFIMQIKFGSIVTDGKGKLGGHVFSHNRYGNYVRTKVTPHNPRSESQLAIRQLFLNLSETFYNLSSIQINQWNNAAAHFAIRNQQGDIKKLSGISLFIKLNSSLHLINLPMNLDAPLPDIVGMSGTFDLTAGSVSQSLHLNYSTDPDFTNTSMLIFGTPPLSRGKLSIDNQFKLLGKVDSITGHIIDASAMYLNKFAKITPDDYNIYILTKMVSKTSGQLTSGNKVVSQISHF
jgi:hypothetical protein